MKEQSTPNISVIVITYNSSKTVLETLDSIYNQTYRNIELIISDDCSKDNTIEIIEKWIEEKRERFINVKLVVGQSNTGVAGNCNRGVKAISTEYYKIIAGDDILENVAIEKYVEFIKNNSDAIGVAKVTPFGEVAEDKIELWKQVFSKGYAILNESLRKKYKRLVVRNYICAPAVGLVKKEWYELVNGFSEEYPFCEDHPMYIKLMEAGYDFKLINEYLIKYRISETALSGGASPLLLKSTVDFFWKEKAWKLLKNGNVLELVMQSVLYIILTIKNRNVKR